MKELSHGYSELHSLEIGFVPVHVAPSTGCTQAKKPSVIELLSPTCGDDARNEEHIRRAEGSYLLPLLSFSGLAQASNVRSEPGFA